LRLLIVDDDPTALQTLRAHLARPGYSVVEANNGALALELLAQQEFDVIVVDGMMPGLDGFETCQRIKDSPDWERIPL
jgi:CheY-like chemotaxis protein